jgi:quinol-cytochrome oxidoreductase complex cytochrome b subunit
VNTHQKSSVINRRTISIVAGVTFILGVIGAFIGNDPEAEAGPIDLVWIGLLLSLVLLVVLVLAVLGRAVMNRKGKA